MITTITHTGCNYVTTYSIHSNKYVKKVIDFIFSKLTKRGQWDSFTKLLKAVPGIKVDVEKFYTRDFKISGHTFDAVIIDEAIFNNKS